MALALALVIPTNSNAEPMTGHTRPGLIATAALNPDKVSTSSLAVTQHGAQMPAESESGLWDMMESSTAPDINAFRWDAATATVHVYSSIPTPTLRALTDKYLPHQAVMLEHAVHSKAQIDKQLSTLATQARSLPNGTQLVSAQPALDGSSITVGVHSSPNARLTPNTLVNDFTSAIPLNFTETSVAVPTIRNIDYYVNFFSGAYMETQVDPTHYRACTTGFRITNLVTGQPGMLSAEHCGRDYVGNSWHYSTLDSAESLMGTYSGMLTDAAAAPFATDTGLWEGTAEGKFYPAVWAGDENDASVLYAIRGAVVPVVGNAVCYSGAFSGNVCDNTVTSTGALVCYSITQCYINQTYTSQDNDIPAAGNGDSGGPVYAAVNGEVYAAGVISGVEFGGDDCTGQPADSDRVCSATAIFSPLSNALSDTDWGLNYVP